MPGPSSWWGCCPCSICVLGVPLGKGTGRSHCVAVIPPPCAVVLCLLLPVVTRERRAEAGASSLRVAVS